MSQTHVRRLWAPVTRHGAVALAVGALLVMTACFSRPSRAPLPASSYPAQRQAILPVVASSVSESVEPPKEGSPYKLTFATSSVEDQEEIARITNEVLDNLARGDTNPLQGPGKLQAVLARSRQWPNLGVYLADTGPIDESWKKEGLAEFAREIGYGRVIRVLVSVVVVPEENTSHSANSSWHGTVALTAQDLDLATGTVVKSASGKAEFSGVAGAIGVGGGPAGIIIPYGWGKTLGRAADLAARDALSTLFGNPASKEVSK